MMEKDEIFPPFAEIFDELEADIEKLSDPDISKEEMLEVGIRGRKSQAMIMLCCDAFNDLLIEKGILKPGDFRDAVLRAAKVKANARIPRK